MHELIRMGLDDIFNSDSRVSTRLPRMREEVRRGHLSSFSAARELLALFKNKE
jgi:hypothetical protein